MNRRVLVVIVALSLGCCALAQAAEPGHEGHHHGGSSEGLTITSLLLTSGGAVIVTLTLLAILWKPIDTAFRLSRFRARWEQRSTRVSFAIGAIVLAGVAVGTFTHLANKNSDHALDTHNSGVPQPKNGGELKVVSRYGLELVLRRTGEVRLYITILNGDTPTSWDIKASVIPTRGFFNGTPTNAVPLKLNANSSYFVSVVPPPEKRQAGIHLSLAIKDEKVEVDFEMPVQD
ncbi:MAG: hypothetical protein EXS18_06870 [Verrucomicrobiae bacterium]|nr:hypothetical protein [Verrucomicrobiae bacterium]